MNVHSFLALGWLFVAASLLSTANAQSNLPVYTDHLGGGWADWSWARADFTNTAQTHQGSNSIAVTAAPWEALYLHHEPLNPGDYTNLTFWIHGGAGGGQLLLVQAVFQNASVAAGVELPPLPGHSWVQMRIPMHQLAPPNQEVIDGFWIQNHNQQARGTFYMDDIELLAKTDNVAEPVPVRINAAARRHPISAEIYGVSFATRAQADDLNLALNRWGGNDRTRYNWQQNAYNSGSDWFFESHGSTNTVPGQDADNFISDTKAAGAEPMMTIPIIGWVAKLAPGREQLASFSIAKYGPQIAHDPHFPDAGNGIAAPLARPITNNNPHDANLSADVPFQSNWVAHLKARWGGAANNGLRYYLLDNEPSLWHQTHRDVHPRGQTLQELRDLSVRYATMIKNVDPDAQVVGPEEWGWPGFFYSGFDQQWGTIHGFDSSRYPDRATNGGWDYMPCYLDQMRQHSRAAGRRLLDVFTVHYYPQNGEFSSDVSTPIQLYRNQSTRALWDTNYVDPSWIQDKVMLIPRLKQWIAQYYPGTRIGITEYSWGADNHINGAIAQADVLGIFGRENLDVAARWTVPPTGTPTYNAFKMYRNFDGKKSTFGDVSIDAITPQPDKLSAFAAIRSSDGALTLMLLNKLLESRIKVSVQLDGFKATSPAQAWQLTSANSIDRLPDVPVPNNKLQTTLPAQSITLFLLK